MKKWEYTWVQLFHGESADNHSKLNRLSHDGWEMVGVSGGRYSDTAYFKREIIEKK